MNLKCAVCGRPAGLQRFDTAPESAVCEAAPCRLVMDRQLSMTPQAFKGYLDLQSQLNHERRAERERQEARLREQALEEAAENAVRWAEAEAGLRLAGCLPPRSDRLALPSGPRRLSNLPEHKRRRYRDHLNQIIAAALTQDEYVETTRTDEPPDPPSDALTLRGNLCAACGGGCCAEGGHTAYLTVPIMRRFMQQHPELRPREVLAAYLDRLSHRTESGSCVNHAAGGCSLPREMRSDTCNRFLCPPLHQIRSRQAGPNPPQAVVVILRRQNQWNQHRPGHLNDIVGAALVTLDGVSSLN